MRKQVNMKKYFPEPNKLLLIAMLGWSAVVWSWVFFVDATTLTNATALSYIIRSVVFGVHVGFSIFIFYKVASYFLRKYQEEDHLSWTFLVKFFVVWSFTEWFVSWLLALIWFGRGASIDSVTTFSSFTPILMYTPLKFLARYAGFYGLSALVITFGVCLCAKKLRRFAVSFTGIILLLCLTSWFFYNVPSGSNVDVVTSSEKLSENPQVKTDAMLVILPEYGLDDFNPEQTERRIASTNNRELFFVGSKLSPARKGLHNTLIFGSTKQGILSEQNKTRLVAGSEYIPFVVKIPLLLTRQTEILNAFEVARVIERGDRQIQPSRVNDQIVIGAEVCSSIISPEDYRHLTNEGATLLTNSASLGVFGGSRVYRIQHDGMARFHAVANSRPFIQSALDEASYMLNHNGDKLVAISPISTVEHEITTNTKTTPYTLLGDWPVYIGFAYLAFLVIKVLRKRFRSLF